MPSSSVRSQFGRNFVSSLLLSILSFPPPPPLHKLNQDERTSFVRPFRSPLIFLVGGGGDGCEMRAAGRRGSERRGQGERRGRGSQVKNDHRGRCVSVSGKRCIIIPILSLLPFLPFSSLTGHHPTGHILSYPSHLVNGDAVGHDDPHQTSAYLAFYCLERSLLLQFLIGLVIVCILLFISIRRLPYCGYPAMKSNVMIIS